ncbi:hypothetical protein LCGC14_1973060 [marine sediment metagenome]|uniref:Histidine kinase N-terminal 7TM region domain-containing protein n=1 Tax=marine sediment metagenome TaxID=412755 RepID=A0A0F9HPI6_9ZZZZ
MALTSIGWLNGITASGVFLFSVFFGLFVAYKSRKTHLNLLMYLGFTYFFAGLIYTGDFLDFLSILITQTNVDNSIGIIGLINWMWFPGVVLFAMFFGAELIIPKRKWLIFFIYLVLGIIFEIFLLLDLSGSVTYVYPSIPGEDLINDSLVFESIPGILMLFFLLSILVFDGIGFLRKSIQSTGVIRKKFFLLSLGAFIYIIGGILDGLFSPGIALIFIRSAMAISAVLFYLGVKQ